MDIRSRIPRSDKFFKRGVIMRKIGILTSGGDTPGMNAAIRASFKMADYHGLDVMGVYHGYKGLMEGIIRELGHEDCDNIAHQGGTILRTARSEIFKEQDGLRHCVKVIDAFGIDAMVIIGGDGTYNGALTLAQSGVPIACLPGTIDNDLGYTDFSIGFDTAVNSVMEEIYKIRDTMTSHDRVGVVEVMGRACGDIALHAGVSGAADYILVPEETPDGYAEACDVLVSNKLRGKLTSIVMVAEGAGGAQSFCDYVQAHTDIEIRPIVLGYIQRGGNPSSFDRVNATRMGARAVDLLIEGQKSVAVGLRNNDVYSLGLADAIAVEKKFDKRLYELNNIMARF